MKRVQLILEEWQHEWLGDESERQETNMSALLREMLTEAIERKQAETLADDPIWGVIGLGEGPDDGVTSENLDDFLYQADWQGQELARVAEKSPGLSTGSEKESENDSEESA